MSNKNLVFVLNLHHLYIKFSAEEQPSYEAEGALFHQQISRVYLPLLNLLSRFKEKKLNAKVALVFSASVLELLRNPELRKSYNKWLDGRIEFCRKEVERCKKNSALLKNAKANLASAQKDKSDYNQKWNSDLIRAFASFSEEGYAEILATCGSYIFMPHFSDLKEVLNAQVESGLLAVRQAFGSAPDGFFLPEMGYCPGLEEILRSYGVGYTVLPSRSFVFSSVPPENGIFAPARCQNGLTVYAASDLLDETGLGDEYKDLSKDAAWELSSKELSPFIKEGHSRHATLSSYYACSGEVYSAEAAAERALNDAKAFVESKKKMLDKAAIILGEDVPLSLSFVVDLNKAGRKWQEFYDWLFCVAELGTDALALSSYSALPAASGLAQKIAPYPAAFSEFSYGEDFISSRNSWMIRYLRKACERIVDLVSRFPGDGGLKTRLLNLGARELLLAQDCTLFKMVDQNYFSEFASEYFKRAVVSFSNVYDALGSNSVSTEWFCNLEKLHPIFPWLNYRIFSKKK